MLSKFYSLDECYNKDVVFDYLENLQNEEIIVFEILDNDVIKIKDIGLSDKQLKEIVNFFDNNDVIDYVDYDGDDDSDDDDDDYYDDNYYPNDSF
jgi:hypothetical protein